MIQTREKSISYSINSFNQLVAKISQEVKPKVIKGRFVVNSENNLIYQITGFDKWCRKYSIPKIIEFEGAWRLNENHDLVLNLKKGEYATSKELVLRGNIIDQGGDSFIFKIKSKISRNTTKITYLNLKGIWKVDKYNRLTFNVNKNKRSDILTLRGIWDVNKYQQITYTYSKLKTKGKKTITFDGYWQITVKQRIQYILSSQNGSYFDIKVHLQTNTLYPSQNKIKYRVGIGIAKQREDKILTLYGQWKFNRRLGVSFEMKHKSGKRYSLKFTGAINIKPEDKIIISLNTEDGKPVGATLQFTHSWLKRKDAQAFLRLQRLIGQKTAIKTGIRLRF